jgi:hypothetical protein
MLVACMTSHSTVCHLISTQLLNHYHEAYTKISHALSGFSKCTKYMHIHSAQQAWIYSGHLEAILIPNALEMTDSSVK